MKPTTQGPRPRRRARRGPPPNAKLSVVRSSCTAISCLRGGEFPYPLREKKCQRFREGYTSGTVRLASASTGPGIMSQGQGGLTVKIR